MTRRELLKASLYGFGVAAIPLRLQTPRARPLRLAVITDLHHGLAPDAAIRLDVFAEAVRSRRELDLALQLGDFCYSQEDSKPVVKRFNDLKVPKLHVLGNHDMDKCDKDAAMRCWGMEKRFSAHRFGGYRFITLDLNHYRKEGKLVSYAEGNYFTANATHNWADPEQLAWLDRELRASREPVILLSHQPLGFTAPGQPLPAEQDEVFRVIDGAAKANPGGAVAACICGHMHVDRLQTHQGIPCYCVNSASYFWHGGMQPYTRPLFAFIELTPDGTMRVQGVAGEFVKPPPSSSDGVDGRSASISDRSITLNRRPATHL